MTTNRVAPPRSEVSAKPATSADAVQAVDGIEVDEPVIERFTANRTSGVLYKEKVRLSWQATSGEYRLLENGREMTQFGDQPRIGSVEVEVTPGKLTGELRPTAKYTLRNVEDHTIEKSLEITVNRYNAIFLIAETAPPKQRYLRRQESPGVDIARGTRWSSGTDIFHQFYLVPDRRHPGRFKIGVLAGIERGEVWYLDQGGDGWYYIQARPNESAEPKKTWFYLDPPKTGRIRAHYDDGGEAGNEFVTTTAEWAAFRSKPDDRWRQDFNPHVAGWLSEEQYAKIAEHFDPNWG